jgi:hypothetical protein
LRYQGRNDSSRVLRKAGPIARQLRVAKELGLSKDYSAKLICKPQMQIIWMNGDP